MSFGGLLDSETPGFVHVTEVGDDPVARTALSPYRLDECPVVVSLAPFINRNLSQKHVPIYDIEKGVRKRQSFHYIDFSPHN